MSGNIKPLLPLIEKEAAEKNIKFDKNAFYDSLNIKDPEVLELSDVLKITERSAKPNLANVKIANNDSTVYDE